MITSSQQQPNNNPAFTARFQETHSQNGNEGNYFLELFISSNFDQGLNGSHHRGEQYLSHSLTQSQNLSTFSLQRNSVERVKPKSSQEAPQRSMYRIKSEIRPRSEDVDVSEDNDKINQKVNGKEKESHGWDSRHGFEDRYASEECVSQLANVGYAFLS